MIFGFNTDIKHENTVYHVQSEARQHDLLLQTQVFVRGRCIGKHATSYADRITEPGFSDEHMHDLLKNQHKGIIDAIRSGGLEELFPSPDAATVKTQKIPAVQENGNATHAEAQQASDELAVQWVNSNAVYEQNSIVMRFAVTRGASKVEGAQLTSRLNIMAEPPIYSQATTGSDGVAEMKIFLDESALAEAAVLVQATHDGHHATRKFRLRKNQ